MVVWPTAVNTSWVLGREFSVSGKKYRLQYVNSEKETEPPKRWVEDGLGRKGEESDDPYSR